MSCRAQELESGSRQSLSRPSSPRSTLASQRPYAVWVDHRGHPMRPVERREVGAVIFPEATPLPDHAARLGRRHGALDHERLVRDVGEDAREAPRPPHVVFASDATQGVDQGR